MNRTVKIERIIAVDAQGRPIEFLAYQTAGTGPPGRLRLLTWLGQRAPFRWVRHWWGRMVRLPSGRGW